MIPAHDSPVAAMAFNSAGTKLSTASEKASLKISKLSCIFFSKFLMLMCGICRQRDR